MEEHEVVDESRSRGPYDLSIDEDEFPSRNVFDCWYMPIESLSWNCHFTWRKLYGKVVRILYYRLLVSAEIFYSVFNDSWKKEIFMCPQMKYSFLLHIANVYKILKHIPSFFKLIMTFEEEKEWVKSIRFAEFCLVVNYS